MDRTPQQEAEKLLRQFGKDEALKRATQIMQACQIRSLLGKGTRYEYWQDVIGILLDADGNNYPPPPNPLEKDLF